MQESLQEVGQGIHTLVNYVINVNDNVLEKYMLETQASAKTCLSEECIY